MSAVAKLETPKRSLLGSLAERYGMEPKAFEMTIRKTVMPNPHSDEEFAACCLVAHEHNLNPITREIYFMRGRDNVIRPIVGVDGWIRKCNEHPAFNGINFEDIHDDKGVLTAIKCIIHRKDRDHPIVVTEYLAECQRNTDNWKQMKARMLRHRALIQCTRVAIGFAGVMDADEFEQWQERYRGEMARDVTPVDEFSGIKFRPKKVVELPDIPDEPAAPEAAPEPAPPAKDASTRTDDQFKEALTTAYASAKDIDSLNEHLLQNQDEIEERGLQQWASDAYSERKGRLY